MPAYGTFAKEHNDELADAYDDLYLWRGHPLGTYEPTLDLGDNLDD